MTLGGFNVLMSFLRTIGTIMSGSCIEDLFKLIYAENCFGNILMQMNENSRLHFITNSCVKILPDLLELDKNECDELDYYARNVFDRPTIKAPAINNKLKSACNKFVNSLDARGLTVILWV